MTPAELENYKMHRRFDRFGRLVGDSKMKRLMSSHVAIIGCGGVGSWAAEMIVRSGVGKVTLVDFDEVCITNFNRQLPAIGGTVGEKKAEVLAERFRKINPQAQIKALVRFYNQDSCEEIFAEKPEWVIDAIDSVSAKCHLIDYCKRNGIKIISSTGSGGRLDPTQVKVADLGQTEIDPLARALRRILRQQYGFPEGEYGVYAVYSPEASTKPEELLYDNGKGFRCVCPQGDNPYFNCDSRNLIMGNAGFVTSTFGNVCASVVVRDLIADAAP